MTAQMLDNSFTEGPFKSVVTLAWWQYLKPEQSNTSCKHRGLLLLMQIDNEARLLGCLNKLYHLTSQTLVLCHNHLQWRLLLAREGSGNKKGHKIMWIVQNEVQKWQQCRINNAVKNARGWSILRESIHIDTGEHCCMHGAMLKTLVPWWMLLAGKWAPMNAGLLAKDMGLCIET